MQREFTGKTVEEAIQNAMDELGVVREQLEVTVVREGRGGILGLGAEEATILVEQLAQPVSPVESISKRVVETLLAKIGLEGDVERVTAPFVAEGDEDTVTPVTFNITGEDLGLLIGRQGHTLSTFQYVVRLLVASEAKTWVPVIVDVEGYRQRRFEALKSQALRVAERVKIRRAPFTLRPMPAFERRIIHLSLADSPDVYTESTGTGESRRVVIMPKRGQR